MYNCEEFMDFCNSMMIAEEGVNNIGMKIYKKTSKLPGLGYKAMRRSSTSVISLKKQIHDAKKDCELKLNQANETNNFYGFDQWLDKQIRGMQRKINGNEIKRKTEIKELQNVYLKYKKIIEPKLQ